MMSRSSGWSGGPGYSSPKHRWIWYSGSWPPSCRWARNSTGSKTGGLGIPPGAYIPCPCPGRPHPHCAPVPCAHFHIPIPVSCPISVPTSSAHALCLVLLCYQPVPIAIHLYLWCAQCLSAQPRLSALYQGTCSSLTLMPHSQCPQPAPCLPSP